MAHVLEHRIPPPLVGLIAGAGMWLATTPAPESVERTGAAVIVLACGLAVMLAAVLSFRASRTTVNPLKPEQASALVTGGVFRFTRNPMYVGMALLLVAWAIYLGHPWLAIGPVAFGLYITRFQIIPEERALLANFGESFTAYKARVRRWL